MGKALARYEQAQGKSDATYEGAKAPAEFDLPIDSSRPVQIAYKLTQEDEKFIGTVPKDHPSQAKAERLPYENFLELVAEKFHARREFLLQLNPGFDWDKAKPGDEVQVPNVATPFDLQAVLDLKTKTEAAEKANELNTEKEKPPNEQFSVEVDIAAKTDGAEAGRKTGRQLSDHARLQLAPRAQGRLVHQGFRLDADFPLGPVDAAERRAEQRII